MKKKIKKIVADGFGVCYTSLRPRKGFQMKLGINNRHYAQRYRPVSTNQVLKVQYDYTGNLRASVYVPSVCRSYFLDELPDWLDRSGVWTGDCTRWACLVNPDRINDPYPAIFLYVMLVDALASAMRRYFT